MKQYCHNCEMFLEDGDVVRTTESDPYGTGDSWHCVETYVCAHCKSDDVDEEVACEACDDALPLDDFDDCARCILTDQYTHDKTYDDDQYTLARAILRRQDPAALLVIDEDIARTIDRGRP